MMETTAAGHGDLESQVGFLQSLVFRLSQEVSRSAQGVDRSALQDEANRVLQALPEDVEVPEWLVSVDVLSPVLRTFESYTNELKRTVEDGKTKCRDLESRVKSVVAENSSLREEVVGLTERVFNKLQEQSLKSSAFPDNASSRIELLEQENDLLRVQNGQLSREIAGLHASLDDKEDALASLQDQRATTSESVGNLQRENNSLKAKLIDSKARIEELRSKVSGLEEAKPLATGGEAAGSPGVTVTEQRADKARRELSDLREDNVRLAEEVGSQRAALQSASAESADLRKQLVSLTDLSAKLELRNTELQAKEFDSIGLIQSLNEKLKQERALNEIHSKRKEEHDREVRELQAQAKGHAGGLKGSLKELYQTRVSVAESSARRMEDLVSNLKREAAYAKAQHEKAQRDATFFEKQVWEMKELNRGYPNKVEEYLRRIERLEEERDAARHESSSTSTMAKRTKSDHERLVSSLKMERERAEKLAELSTAECKKLQEELQRMHSAVRESESSLAEAQRAEAEVRHALAQKMEAQKAESGEQVKFLKRRLEEEIELRKDGAATLIRDGEGDTAVQASRREAEDARIRYESMERQLRAESMAFSRKLEAVGGENAKLREENSKIARHLSILTRQNREASGCISDAENELISLRERLKSSVSKEAQLIQEKEIIYSNLEAAKLEMAKAQRAQNSSMKKVEFLRSQCETLQHALASSRIIPGRTVTA